MFQLQRNSLFHGKLKVCLHLQQYCGVIGIQVRELASLD